MATGTTTPSTYVVVMHGAEFNTLYVTDDADKARAYVDIGLDHTDRVVEVIEFEKVYTDRLGRMTYAIIPIHNIKLDYWAQAFNEEQG